MRPSFTDNKTALRADFDDGSAEPSSSVIISSVIARTCVPLSAWAV